MSKIKAGFVIAVLAALTAMLFVQQRNLAIERTEVAGLTARRNRVVAATAAAHQRAAEAGAALDKLSGVARAGIRPAVAARPRTSAATLRVNFERNYAPLLRRLNLNAPDLEMLKELLVERDVEEWDAQRFATEAMGGRSMDQWTNRTEQWELTVVGTREIDGRIQTLLGDVQFGYYLEYQRSRSWREPFNELAEQLVYREPLRDEHVDQLAAWAAEANPDLWVDPARGGPRVSEAVIDRARAILSPFQLDKLRRVKASTDAFQRMMILNRTTERADTAPDAVDRHRDPPSKGGQ